MSCSEISIKVTLKDNITDGFVYKDGRYSLILVCPYTGENIVVDVDHEAGNIPDPRRFLCEDHPEGDYYLSVSGEILMTIRGISVKRSLIRADISKIYYD